MAIIDLSSGKITDEAPAQFQSVRPIQEPKKGGVIDLETGGFVGSAAPPPLPGVSSFGAELTPPDLPPKTRAERDLPELGSGGLLAGEDTATIAKIAPLLLVTTDPNEIADIVESNFENIKRTTTGKDGIVLLNNRETGAQVVINKPGISKIDILQGLGLMTAFSGPAALGRAALGRGAFGLSGLKAAGLAGGVGAGGQQGAIEIIQQQLGGEINEEEIALAGTLGFAAEAVVPAIRALRDRRAAKQLGVEVGEVAEAVERIGPAREAIEGLRQATGVNVGLFKAQQTQQPSTLIKQRLLPQLNASSRKAVDELERQNKDVFDATMNLINQVAPERVAETGAKRFRKAAQDSIASAVKARSDAVRPLYKDAFEEAGRDGLNVDLKPVTNFVKQELDSLVSDDPAAKALKSFLGRLKGTKTKGIPAGKILGAGGEELTPAIKGEVKPLSLEQLQSAKRTTDAIIDQSGGIALNSAQKNAKRLLSQAEKLYVDQIGKVSPKFKVANEEFARLSAPVKELEDSILGTTANIKDVNLKDITSKIFNPTETNPTVIKKAKQIIQNVDPGAWDDILRVEFQRRVGGMAGRAETEAIELSGNTPGQLRRAIFGSDPKRNVLLAGMNPTQKKNFLWLESVLKRAESGRAQGSPTAGFLKAMEDIKGVFSTIRDTIFSPLKTIQGVGEGALFDRNASKFADVLFNPKWEPKLRELRTANPTTEKAGKIFREIFEAAKPAVQVERIEEQK